MIPEICQRAIITSFNSTIGLPKIGTTPPNAVGPKIIPANTNPIISGIL
jgi:hypothetical protein